MDARRLYHSITKAFNERDNDTFFRLFDEYVCSGYGIDAVLIYYYASMLVFLRQFDSSYKNLKLIEDYMIEHHSHMLVKLYLYCFKPKEVERIIKEYNLYDGNEKYLIRAYLLQEKIVDACQYIKELRIKGISDLLKEDIKLYETLIQNYYEKDAYMELEYESFVENGRKLEPGHIVYLKKAPVVDYRNLGDFKGDRRPYMIWRIDKDTLYLFPVSTAVKEDFCYKLYQQKYPNSCSDRFVKVGCCRTTIDNVLSVKDKVLPEDYRIILRSIYLIIYHTFNNGNSLLKHMNKDFIDFYAPVPKLYDIVEMVDTQSNCHRYYFVLKTDGKFYETVEVDKSYTTVIGGSEKNIRKGTMFFGTYEISDDIKQELLAQYYSYKVSHTITYIGKKITVLGRNLIIIGEGEDECYCVNSLYHSSVIERVTVKKKDIESFTGEVSSEEIFNIKKLLHQSGIPIVPNVKKKASRR